MNTTPASSLPLVSVIVPVYNHAPYVLEALDSVREEGYPHLELLILDDGSRDDSFPIVTAWVEQNAARFARIKAWSQPNAGVCRTLNRLIAEASGEFVTMVASDDRLLPGGIQARVEALEQHPEWLLVFGDAQTIDGKGALTQTSTLRAHRADLEALNNPSRLPFELLLRWSLPGPVYVARRSAWDPVEGVGPYDETLFLEDRDFYLKLLARRAVGFLPEAVAQYRVHGSNACKDPARRPVLRETLARSAEQNVQRFSGVARRILVAQAQERRSALEGKRWTRLRAKLVLGGFRVLHRLQMLRMP
ncbi:MAG: glycosyltransferase [Firmicutes bacterium]|nr:glycosyltransferase [Bacillota bacterium]